MKPRLTFQPGNSLLHRAHPLVKLAWLLFATAAVFVIPSPWLVAAVVVVATAAFPLCRLRLGRLWGTRLFAGTALLLALLQVLFNRQGAVIFQLGPLAPTTGGVAAGVYVGGRFLTVVLASYLFVLTTDPSDLAYALMRAGLPYRYGFALVTALRMVALFEQEGQTVYRAQLARGVQYDVRHPRRLLLLAQQFFLPLLVSALGKVDSLAVSMEGRCFGKYRTRTFLQQVHLTRADAALVVLLLAAVAATVSYVVIP
jgi:energy-coupling factor transport system permease protein